MSNALLITTVLVVLLGGLFSVVYWMDKRGKAKYGSLPEPGPIGQALKWLGVTLLVVVGVAAGIAIALRSIPWVRLAGNGLWMYLVAGLGYRLVLRTGK